MDTRKCIEEGQHRASSRHTRLECPTREQIQDFADAHAEGLHDEVPREFCPDCS